MEHLNFKNLTKIRKSFLLKHENDHFVYELGEHNILFSMPHAVNHVRLGKLKYAEPGTVALGLILARNLNANYIIRTKNVGDDPNFDEVSEYREKIKYLLSVKGIKYLIDIHGLKKSRECDINLGIHLGQNIKTDVNLYERLETSLKQAGFNVVTDNPFMGGANTISGYFSQCFNIWTIQLEVNSKITNESKYINQLKCLIDVITRVFKTI